MTSSVEQGRPIRYPLQTGESAFVNIIVGATVTILGATFLSSFAIIPLALSLDSGALMVVPFILPLIGVYVFYFGLARLRRAYNQRASDVVLSSRGVTFVGGKHHDRELAWKEIDPARCELYLDENVMPTRNGQTLGAPMYKLLLGLRDGDMLELAETREPGEQGSLEALANALRAPAWHDSSSTSQKERSKAGRWRDQGLVVLVCNGCGAPCAPSSEATTHCLFCGADVAVPAELRAKIDAAARVEVLFVEEEKAVGKLLDQPGPSNTNKLLFATTSIALLGGPALVIALSPTIALVVAGVAASLYLGAHGHVIDRCALRLLSLNAAAQSPDTATEPHLCRLCDAPLPRANGTRVVVACSYCGAENVLDVDLRREAVTAASDAKALTTLLAQRSQRRKTRALAFGAALIVAGLGVVLLISAAYAPQLNP